MKHSRYALMVAILISLTALMKVNSAINCPNGGPVNLATEDEDNWTGGLTVPPLLGSIAGAAAGWFGIGSMDPEPIQYHLQHWEICCNDGTDSKGEWKTYWANKKFTGTLTLSEGISLSGWYGQLVDAILGSGYEDPDLQALDDALGGLEAEGAGVSGTIQASYYDPYQVMDTCACDEDEYETFLGGITYEFNSSIGQYSSADVPDLEIPGLDIPDFEAHLLDLNFRYRKSGIIGGSTALVSTTLTGHLKSYFRVGTSDRHYFYNSTLNVPPTESTNPWCAPNALTSYQ